MADPPLVSFVLICYNQEEYIADAIAGAFGQTHDNLELIFSDDASTDSTFSILAAAVSGYTGPHRVRLRQSAENLGVAGNVNEAFALARGDLVVVASGDDVSLPERTALTTAAFERFADAVCVDLAAVNIDRAGNVLPATQDRAPPPGAAVSFDIGDYFARRSPRLIGATRAFRRLVIDTYGPLENACPTEDTPYLLRSLMLGRGVYLNRPGVRYRTHSRSLSEPPSMTRMPVDRLLAQYLSDAQHARSQGLIDEPLFVAIREWADRNAESRRLANGYAESRAKLGYFVRNMLFSSALTLRRKLYFLKRALKGA